MSRDRLDSVPLVGAAGAVIALVCCAGLPLVGAVLGGLTLAAVIGVAGGVLLATCVAATGLFVLRRRRRRGWQRRSGGRHDR